MRKHGDISFLGMVFTAHFKNSFNSLIGPVLVQSKTMIHNKLYYV